MQLSSLQTMRLGLAFFAILVFSELGMSQDIQLEERLSFNQRRIELNKRAMLVLGGWATANILAGSALAGRSDGTRKAFHQMNAYWNTVNLAIAGFGYYQATKEVPSEIGLAGTVEAQYAIQQALLFNAGLDLAYIAGGFYMMERSKRHTKHADRWKGFGQSLVLQGGFLFAFDLTVFLLQQSRQKGLQELLSHIQASNNGIGLQWFF